MDFFKALNFSSANEDGETELAALDGAKRIICLTGSGTRPLDMLLSGAEDVVALDANPAQNALLALKMAAIAQLDRADYLAFVGISPSPSRTRMYDSLRSSLPLPVRNYWDHNRRLVASGIWSSGKWERLLRWNARFLALFHARAVSELMSAATVGEQARVWQKHFSGSRLRNAVESVARDWLWRLLMREPSAAFLPSPREASNRLQRDFEMASRSFLFRDSDCAALVFHGKHSPDGPLPVHMRPENYDRLRQALPRLRIVEGGLEQLAHLNTGAADGFSLSDFGSYCGLGDYARCWRGIVSVSVPGARFCERIFMNDMDLSFPEIAVDKALSERLSREDKAIVYRIRAGTIGRPA